MKQLAASESRVAALEQQLKDKASQPPNSRGDTYVRRERTYFSDYPPKPQHFPWFPSPAISDNYFTPVTAGVPIADTSFWCDVSLTPPSPLLADNTSYASVCLRIMQRRQTRRRCLLLKRVRAYRQQLFIGNCPVVLPPAVTFTSTMSTLSSISLAPNVMMHPSQGLVTPIVSTGLEGPRYTILAPHMVTAMAQTTLIAPLSRHLAQTAAVAGQIPMLASPSIVSTQPVGTIAIAACPPVAIIAPPAVAAIPLVCTIASAAHSFVAATLPVGTVASITPPSVASSLPVGTSVSLSCVSSLLPSYEPLVVVNTPQVVRPYNGSTSWTSFRDHFARVAKVNLRDDDNKKAQHLMLALAGNSAEVLKEISDSSSTVLQDI